MPLLSCANTERSDKAGPAIQTNVAQNTNDKGDKIIVIDTFAGLSSDNNKHFVGGSYGSDGAKIKYTYDYNGDSSFKVGCQLI